ALREGPPRRAGPRLRRRGPRPEPPRGLAVAVVIPVDPRPRRDEMPDDDVLLEAQQIVLGAPDRRVGQHARRLLERRRRNERLCGEARLGDTQEQRLARGRLAALLPRALVHLAERELVHVLTLE